MNVEFDRKCLSTRPKLSGQQISGANTQTPQGSSERPPPKQGQRYQSQNILPSTKHIPIPHKYPQPPLPKYTPAPTKHISIPRTGNNRPPPPKQALIPPERLAHATDPVKPANKNYHAIKQSGQSYQTYRTQSSTQQGEN